MPIQDPVIVANTSITTPTLSGTVAGTYTLGGTPTISSPTFSGTLAGTYTIGGTPTFPAGHVLQVVSTTFNTAQSINTTTFTEITGLTTSITPISTSSRILVLVNVRWCGLVNGAETAAHFRLRRDTTDICQGSGATGSMINATASGTEYDNDVLSANLPINFLDSPSTTSSVSYKIMAATYTNGLQVNRPNAPDGAFYNGFVTSTMILMEIA